MTSIQKLRLQTVRLLGKPVEVLNKRTTEESFGIVSKVELGGLSDWMIIANDGALGGIRQFTLEIVSRFVERPGKPLLIELN